MLRRVAGGEVARTRATARQFADRWQDAYQAAVACLRNDRDELLTCFRYKSLVEREAVPTTNAVERRFVEVRRRTRPMGVFSDRTSKERILFAVFIHENYEQKVRTCRAKKFALGHFSRTHWDGRHSL